MVIGYECKHCHSKFKCKKIIQGCPSCGYWFDKSEDIPVLIQHTEESFLNDPNIPMVENVDDPLLQKMQAIRKKSSTLHDINRFFSDLR